MMDIVLHTFLVDVFSLPGTNRLEVEGAQMLNVRRL